MALVMLQPVSIAAYAKVVPPSIDVLQAGAAGPIKQPFLPEEHEEINAASLDRKHHLWRHTGADDRQINQEVGEGAAALGHVDPGKGQRGLQARRLACRVARNRWQFV
eukprot:CAMPEP_0171058928 /NCGR_PEP_ID=MMETSP0766_2-20121228/2847_1 /TAXON_ID=439317 /ORGANISM="Gambierdiscus australes, Strain CAWD 149" /LENGTH=107 /DNA_ID=CAMNT_0011514287 /DNA_START=567 /DNA_END=890 /DNA_ORIENTATION=+